MPADSAPAESEVPRVSGFKLNAKRKAEVAEIFNALSNLTFLEGRFSSQ